MAKAAKQEEGKVRTTMFIKPENVVKLDYIAWKNGGSRTDEVNEAIEAHIKAFEKKNGPIPER